MHGICNIIINNGFSGFFVPRFKMKVGSNLSDDIRRAAIFRDEIGWDNFLVNRCVKF